MKIKQLPEDFLVKEINSLKTGSINGKYCAFTLKKKYWNTIDAVREIAKRIGINESDIRYSGLKDRNAITEQLITVDITNHKIVQRVKINDISLEFLGMAERHAETSDNNGNQFAITIRDIEKKYARLPKKIPNYYDEQRFGNESNNHDVGRLMVKKKFKEACDLLKITAADNDYVSALKKTGTSHIYFSAYQSYLFNMALSYLIRKDCKKFTEIDISGMKLAFPGSSKCIEGFPERLPLINFDAEFEDERVKEAYESILSQEVINPRDFALRQFPNLVSSSPERQALISVEGFKVKGYSEDELNKGRKKQIVGFSLPRGSYATMVIKALIGKDLLIQ